jgi:8-oxo-dGTP pyrophosphatase MutT (NUDIX family)
MNKNNELIPNKACPVVLRYHKEWEILVFRHPLAGVQLVKGSIDFNESPQQAAIRELFEEAGLDYARVVCDLGTWDSKQNIWSFQLCVVNAVLPDTWTHFCTDDGGHEFTFFWHPLSKKTNDEWYVVFQTALTFIEKALTSNMLNLYRTLSP